MTRPARAFVEGGFYHVCNRLGREERVFAAEHEAAEFTRILKQVAERDDVTVLAWCLLSNLYHIEVRTSAVPLSRSMQRLQGGFAKKFNRRWRRSGPLWQSRYQARVIDSQDDCEQVILHIHLNPARAGLVDNPDDYVFCGHRELVKRIRDPLVDVDHALIGFGSTLTEARRHCEVRD